MVSRFELQGGGFSVPLYPESGSMAQSGGSTWTEILCRTRRFVGRNQEGGGLGLETVQQDMGGLQVIQNQSSGKTFPLRAHRGLEAVTDGATRQVGQRQTGSRPRGHEQEGCRIGT